MFIGNPDQGRSLLFKRSRVPRRQFLRSAAAVAAARYVLSATASPIVQGQSPRSDAENPQSPHEGEGDATRAAVRPAGFLSRWPASCWPAVHRPETTMSGPFSRNQQALPSTWTQADQCIVLKGMVGYKISCFIDRTNFY